MEDHHREGKQKIATKNTKGTKEKVAGKEEHR